MSMKNAMEILLGQRRFDLIFKYLYLKRRTCYSEAAYLESIRAFNGFYELEPSDGIPKQGKTAFLKRYNELKTSIECNGFDGGKGCIPVGTNGEISDGAHRLAVCAYLGLDIDIERDGRNDLYDFDFFRKRGMDSHAMDFGALEYVRLNPNAYMVNLHSVVDVAKDGMILDLLNKFGFVFYRKDVNLTFNGYVNLKKISYGSFWAGENWIGTPENKYAGAQMHARKSFGKNPLRAFLFVCDDLKKIIQVKAEIRNLLNIGNYSVHINDTREEAIQLAELYFNQNSLEMMNARPFEYEDRRFDGMVDELKNVVRRKGADIYQFCAGGSAPLDVLGLRTSEDLDFLYSGPGAIDLPAGNLSNHESESRYYPYPADEIVSNPEFHFYYRGIKVITIDILHAMKKNRNENPKDVNDCRMIEDFKRTLFVPIKRRFKLFEKYRDGYKRKIIFCGIVLFSYKRKSPFDRDFMRQLEGFERNSFEVDALYSNPFGGNVCECSHRKRRVTCRFLRKYLHSGKLEAVYDLLDDAESKNLFLIILFFRVLGPDRVRLPLFHRESWGNVEELYSESFRSEYKTGLQIYNLRPFGYDIDLITNKHWVYENLFLKQYMYHGKDVMICPRKGDFVIDGGACFGDNALCFADLVGETGRVFSFELCPDNIEIFQTNMQMNEGLAKRMTVIRKALSDETGKILNVQVNGGASTVCSGAGGSQLEVSTLAIDDAVASGEIPRVDFIKLDIEGAELAALKGAATTIKRFKPNLAISVYHKTSDYFEIPLYLKSLLPEYRFYFNHYTAIGWESILYATTVDGREVE